MVLRVQCRSASFASKILRCPGRLQLTQPSVVFDRVTFLKAALSVEAARPGAADALDLELYLRRLSGRLLAHLQLDLDACLLVMGTQRTALAAEHHADLVGEGNRS